MNPTRCSRRKVSIGPNDTYKLYEMISFQDPPASTGTSDTKLSKGHAIMLGATMAFSYFTMAKSPFTRSVPTS